MESDAWMALVPYAEPGPLSPEDRRLVRSAIGKANSANIMTADNTEVSLGIAHALGIRQARPKGLPEGFEEELEGCEAVVVR